MGRASCGSFMETGSVLRLGNWDPFRRLFGLASGWLGDSRISFLDDGSDVQEAVKKQIQLSFGLVILNPKPILKCV